LPGDGILEDDIILDFGNPAGTIEISGDAALSADDTGTWTIDISYTGAASGAFSYEVEVNIGSLIIDEIRNSLPATLDLNDDYTINGSTLLITVSGAAFDADGVYTETLEVDFTVPDPVCGELTVNANL